jgi:hypothetical protein
MLAYGGVTYTARVSGTTAVAVRCEQCRNKYHYQLSRTAYGRDSAPYGLGSKTAKRNANKRARRRLEQMLEDDIDPVPCPKCGWYQEAMLGLLQGARLKWMRKTGIISVFVGWGIAMLAAFLLLVALNNERHQLPLIVPLILGLLAVPFLLAAAVLLLVRRHRNAKFDPNDPETEQERMELGRRLSITKEEAEALMKHQDD